MNRIVLVLVCVLFFASEGQSQTDSSRNAIQFNFVNSTSMSYRYRLSGSSELRAGIDITGNLSDRRAFDVPVYYYSTDSLLYRYNPVNTSQYIDLRISIDYLYTLYNYQHVSLYCSVGPFASTTQWRNHYVAEYSPNVEDRTYTRFSWSAGAIFGAGLQCHIYEFVSILGEYTATLGYGYEGSRPGPPDERVITLELEKIHIGVCVRF